MSDEEILNYTSHAIVIFSTNNPIATVVIRPCGVLVYLEIDSKTEKTWSKIVNGNEITVKNAPVYTNVKNLPDSLRNIAVTPEVATFLKNNPHLYAGHVYSADTSNDGAVYNGMGQMIGTRRLIQHK